MEAARASFTPILLFLLFFFLYPAGSSAMHGPKKTPNKPCKELKLFFHDILYNGKNADNATSAIVAGPEGSNRTILEPKNNHFGNVIVINDPSITLDNNLHSPPVGHAQGIYIYDRKDMFSAWMAFTIVLNSTELQGTISVMGADPILEKTRDISVVGGTGDFAMARGIANITTGSFEGEIYFRIRIDIKLYDCWY
ncbi:hypothetical protein ACHQM5_015452 [Ranunculus cassubicifolius]